MGKKHDEVIIDRINEIRELNNHENELINHRFTWMLLIEGLLVNAFVGLVSEYLKMSTKSMEYIISPIMLIVLSSLGFFITLSFRHTFITARTSLRNLKIRYRDLVKLLGPQNDCLCPIAIGLYAEVDVLKADYLNEKKLDPWIALPMLFMFLWLAFLLLGIGLLIRLLLT
jgi:hypothetical protein